MLIEKFEEQVKIRPGKVAVKSAKSALTYEFLNQCANHLAGAVPGTYGKHCLAALLLGHDESMIVGILGILKAGGVYIPFDPTYPQERLLYMLKDSKARLIITNEANIDFALRLKERISSPISILNLDELDFNQPVKQVKIPVKPREAAYILYTSGSTGRPRGVIQTRQNIVYYIEHWSKRFSISDKDRLSLLASFCHDGSVPDIYGALLNGASLYPFDIKRNTYLHQPGQWLAREQITTWHSVPTLYRYFVNTLEPLAKSREREFFPHLRLVVLGGEAVRTYDTRMFDKHFPNTCFANIYGQTESTVSSIWLKPANEESPAVFIGTPIGQTKILIIDERGNELDDLEVGEIILAGDFLSPGYLNDSEATHRVFMMDEELGRVYRTGDQGRQLPDGNIEIMGRKDFQVKIRGFRIELGEIESVLLQHPRVREAVVNPVEPPGEKEKEDQCLCAYFVSPGEFRVSGLREYLAGKIPDYMIPTYFVRLEGMPLTSSGKIDRKALPPPGQNSGETYAPPRGEVEQKLAGIWAEVLGIKRDETGRDINFFQQGGHSLKAIVLVGRIHQHFHLRVPLAEVFNRPFIRQLAAYIENAGQPKNAYTAIPGVEDKEYYPLSPPMRRLFTEQQMNLQNTGYNINSTTSLQGKLDRQKLERTFQRLIRRHEMLRCSFMLVKDEPVLKIHKQVEFEMEYYKVEAEAKVEGELSSSDVIRHLSSEFTRPFDLFKAPLLRVGLIQITGEMQILMLDVHHTAADGISLGILTREFMELYHDKSLPGLKLRYRDFSQWKNSRTNRQEIEKQEKYWLEQFQGEIPVSNLPYDYPRPAVKGPEGSFIQSVISAGAVRGIKKKVLQEGATLYMVTLAIYYILLAKLSGQEDIVVGTAAAGRSPADLEPLIGMFVDTLALRNYPLADKTFKEFLQEVKENTLQAFANQDYGLEKLVEQVAGDRDLSRSPLFDIFFSLQNMEIPQLEVQDLCLLPYESQRKTARYDMGFILSGNGKQVVMVVEYSTCLFKEETIKRFTGYYNKIVSIVIDQPGIKISDIEILTGQEKQVLLYQLNHTHVEYPRAGTLPGWFEWQVEQTPDNTALHGYMLAGMHGGQAAPAGSHDLPIRPISLTYRELNEQSNRVAHLLIEKGVRPDIIVGIMMERSLEMVIGIYGILKAGGAYLPIDPNYPGERIRYMLRDSGVRLLLTRQIFTREMGFSGEIIDIPAPSLCLAGRYRQNPGKIAAPRHLVYMIYTSGSTGNPKGVLVRIGGFLNLLHWYGSEFAIHRADSVLLVAPVSFDLAQKNLFTPLMKGGILCLAPPGLPAYHELSAITATRQITIINAAPSVFYPLVEFNADDDFVKLKSLRYVILGGEPIQGDKFVQWFDSPNCRCELVNTYGPTECTDIASSYRVSKKDLGKRSNIPIGKPVWNTMLYILDKTHRLQPMGVPGQLFIGGEGISRGYLDSPELTREKFDRDLWDYRDYHDKEAPFGQVENAFGEEEAHELHELTRIETPSNQKLLRGVMNQSVSGSVGQLDDWQAQLGIPLIMLPRPNPETNENQHKRFAQHIGSPRRGAPGRRRLYQTGDLARWLADYIIEFLGRMDFQVKVRGYRVEPGEIERQLLKQACIREVLVTVVNDKSGEKALCAYIVFKADQKVVSTGMPGAGAIKEYLSRVLPNYMIPAYIVELEKMPLTPNGKIDRKRLPAPGLKITTAHVPPAAGKEKTIARLWQEVLQLAEVGIHENFFDIGGNSLSLLTVHSKIQKALKVEIPVVELFKYPTIHSLARYLSRDESGEDSAGFFASPAREGKTGGEIAVIGMSCSFPGAEGLYEFWENLENGIESIAFFSGEELEEPGPNSHEPGNSDYVKARGMYEGSEYFDSLFFNYTPREAYLMDPQVRVFHGCVWHALEDAAYNPFTFRGRIGLYAGAASNIYWEMLAMFSQEKEAANPFQERLLRNRDFLCSHISYKLNLKGPTFFVQTACSTSLAAIHLAVRALIDGECEMALAGGVNIAYPQKTGYIYQEGMTLSPDGHCRAFDVLAQGLVGGSGAGAVVLKPYEKAAADRDHIYAVIKGSAINNDGLRKVGFTAPSIEGQVEVIREAQIMAGIQPETITYIETHGTGTRLGDHLEIEALKMSFKSAGKRFCGIGSVKTNIGHLDAAAGAAGFIKTVLALKHRLIPPTLHFNTPNPELGLEDSPFYVVNRLTEWKTNRHPLRAGVTSLGIGGTNAHVILEQAPVIGHSSLVIGEKRKERENQLILLSAKTPSALEKMTENLAAYLKSNRLNRGNHKNSPNPGPTLADAAYTLQIGRCAFRYRRMLVCSNVQEAMAGLSNPRDGKVKTFQAVEGKKPVVFMFPGQGSQYVNMGLELYQTEPVFRRQMDQCFEILNHLLDYNIKDILYPGDSVSKVSKVSEVNSPDPDQFNRSNRSNMSYNTHLSHIDQTGIAQPLLFAFEYALAKLLIGWGLQPTAMIGYSMGEYTAACLSGVFSLEDALKVLITRGQWMRETAAGIMLSVPLPGEEIKPLLTGSEISLAIENGVSAVVSGTPEAVAAFEKQMKKKRLVCAPVNMSHAVHSSLMEPIREEFEKHLGQVTRDTPKIPYISNVSGTWITPQEAVDSAYWGRHLCSTVRFSDGLKRLLAEENAVFIEIGPGRMLSNILRQLMHTPVGTGQNPGQHRQKIVNTVKHQEEKVTDNRFLLSRLGELWGYGIPIDWAAVNREEKRDRVPLPTYSFDKHRYRIDNNLFYRSREKFAFGIQPGTGTREKPFSQEESKEEPLPGAIAAMGQRPGTSTPYAAPRDELERNLVDLWQKYFGIEPVGIHDDFYELGGNSLLAVQIAACINRDFQVRLPAHIFLQTRTIAGLAQSIKENRETPDGPVLMTGTGVKQVSPLLVEMGTRKNSPGGQPLYLVHPIGGHVYFYHDIVEALGSGQEVYGIQAPGAQKMEGWPEPGDIPRMAAAYIEAIQTLQPAGPYCLGGASFGGLAAFEIARQFEALHQEISLLFVIDPPAPGDVPEVLNDNDSILAYILNSASSEPVISAGELRQMDWDTKYEFLVKQANISGKLDRDIFKEQVLITLDNYKAHSRMMQQYKPGNYTGKMLYFRAVESNPYTVRDIEKSWGKLTAGGIEIYDIPGDHITMNFFPHAAAIGSILNARLKPGISPPQKTQSR